MVFIRFGINQTIDELDAVLMVNLKSEFVKMCNKIDKHSIVVEEPAPRPDDDGLSSSTPA